jgi:hypothetical protein
VNATVLLTELRELGATVAVVNGRLRIEARRGVLTPELREALTAYKGEVLALLRSPMKPVEPAFDPQDAGQLVAFKLVNTVIGDLWLVADEDALADHPDIIRSGLPVIFFDEIEQLRGKTVAELRAIGLVKAEFPTSRVLQ